MEVIAHKQTKKYPFLGNVIYGECDVVNRPGRNIRLCFETSGPRVKNSKNPVKKPFKIVLPCLYINIVKAPYEESSASCDSENNSHVIGESEISAKNRLNLAISSHGKLSWEDELFCLESYMQAISEADINAFELCKQIDDNNDSSIPISQWLICCMLVSEDPLKSDYEGSFYERYFEYLTYKCRFEGSIHYPSLRANLYTLLTALARMDIFNKMDQINRTMRKKMLIDGDLYADLCFFADGEEAGFPMRITPGDSNRIARILLEVAKLDSEFLFSYQAPFSHNPGVLKEFMESRPEFAEYKLQLQNQSIKNNIE
jgi:hypothetical protein